MKLKQDKFRKNRGGSSRLLGISCEKCNTKLFYYQKDGPGIIKRLYLDRIFPEAIHAKELVCPKCKNIIGVLTNYKKENRLAYRIFAGAIVKKLVVAQSIK